MEVIMVFTFRITLNGNCAEAVAFYSDVFGIIPSEVITFNDRRDRLGDVPASKAHFIYEAVLDIPGTPGLRLVLGDTPALLFDDNPGNFFAQQFIDITDTDPETIRGLYNRFMCNGKTNKILSKDPPYKLSGSLIDNFGGICWNLYCI